MCHFDCSANKRDWEESGWVTGPLGICQGLFCPLPWLPPLPSREGSGQALVSKECYQLHWMNQADTTLEPPPPLSSSLLPLGCDRAAILQGPLDLEPPSRSRFERAPAEPGITPLGAGTWGRPGFPAAGCRVTRVGWTSGQLGQQLLSR